MNYFKKAKAIIIVLTVLLAVSNTAFAQLSLHWQDLKRLDIQSQNQIFPTQEINYEIYYSSCNFNNIIFIGTSPRGHLLQVDLDHPNLVK